HFAFRARSGGTRSCPFRAAIPRFELRLMCQHVKCISHVDTDSADSWGRVGFSLTQNPSVLGRACQHVKRISHAITNFGGVDAAFESLVLICSRLLPNP